MSSPVVAFLHDTRFADLPEAVAAQARRCLLDLVGVAAGGRATVLSRIIHDHAARHFGAGQGGGARLLFDGRRVSPVGAALAGAATIDSLDGHDGHSLTKGHAGVALLPALLATVDDGQAQGARGLPSGRELLTSLAVGYEVALRAGIALHATAPEYHTSGAWSAVACAGLGARLLGLDGERTRHALGIAEYHGPRSPMMRCIDHPTMVKDGSGWGAMAGVSAAYLAADGFTGAPAALLEGPEVADLWADLGRRWRLLELYFKPYPVCRWAQPAVEAVLALRRRHDIVPEAVERVEIASFHEATRLAVRRPRTTEEAQYSLPFAVAAALARGGLGAAEVGPPLLDDPAILRLSDGVSLTEDPAYSARFPAERLARLTVRLADGRSFASEPTVARGDPDTPLPEAELRQKYRELTEPALGVARSRRIEAAVAQLADDRADVASLLDDLLDALPAEAAPGPAAIAAT